MVKNLMTLLDHVAALVFLIVSKRHGLLAPGIPLPRKQRHSSIPWTDVRGNARTAALVSPSGLLKSLGVASGALLIDAETISEMEVATFRERAQAALFQKAQRGALVRRVAIGYTKGADDRIEKDPDARVRATIDLIFRKFAELGSVRQVYFWLDQQQIQLPIVRGPEDACEILWQPARYHAVHSVLTNPIYAGVYAYMGGARPWRGWKRGRSELYGRCGAVAKNGRC